MCNPGPIDRGRVPDLSVFPASHCPIAAGTATARAGTVEGSIGIRAGPSRRGTSRIYRFRPLDGAAGRVEEIGRRDDGGNSRCRDDWIRQGEARIRIRFVVRKQGHIGSAVLRVVLIGRAERVGTRRGTEIGGHARRRFKDPGARRTYGQRESSRRARQRIRGLQGHGIRPRRRRSPLKLQCAGVERHPRRHAGNHRVTQGQPVVVRRRRHTDRRHREIGQNRAQCQIRRPTRRRWRRRRRWGWRWRWRRLEIVRMDDGLARDLRISSRVNYCKFIIADIQASLRGACWAR